MSNTVDNGFIGSPNGTLVAIPFIILFPIDGFNSLMRLLISAKCISSIISGNDSKQLSLADSDSKITFSLKLLKREWLSYWLSVQLL